MVQIIPAILATNVTEYKEKVDRLNLASGLEGGWVQIDFMDNIFVHNRSIEPNIVKQYPINLKVEAQLMVEYPENWIDELIKIGVLRIVFPIEDSKGIKEKIRHIKNHQIEVGLSLNPETPLERLEPFIDTIDLVLIMSVQPGFGGQNFISGTLEKVRELVRLRFERNLDFKIEVDGGINEEVASKLVEAGADNLVMGSHLLEGDIDNNLERIMGVINS